MSSSIVTLEQQFKFQAWKNCISHSSYEETKKLLLIAVRQAISTNNRQGQIKLQNNHECQFFRKHQYGN